MKDIEELLNEGARIMGEVGFKSREISLQQECRRLSRPKYRVTVIGQFKAGKSTLINRVFLKGNILFTEEQAATAVPTEIEQGTPARLEVYFYRTSEGATGQPRSEMIENPTTDDIRVKTAGLTREVRTEMAKQTVRVRLQWPAPALGDYTIVDTPGINEANEDVVATTYRAIVESDVTVFVAPARTTLTAIDLQFLQSQVFTKGLSRCLVVVNHDPIHTDLSEHRLHDLEAEVRAQLEGIGRRSSVTTIRLEPGIVEPSAASAKSISEFEKTLLGFLQENVQSGRLERAGAFLRSELQQALVECEIAHASLQLTPAERQMLQAKIKRETEAFADRYRDLGDAFLDDLRSVQKEHFTSVSMGLDTVGENFASGFDQCANLGEVQTRLKQGQHLMMPEVEDLFYKTSAETRKRIKELEEKYQAACRQAMEPWLRTLVSELKLDGGFLSKLPPLVVLLGDFFLTSMLLPGGFFIDVIIRLLADRMPLIRNILPVNVAKNIIIDTVKHSLSTQIGEMKVSIRKQLSESFAEAEQRLQENWDKNGQEQLRMILDPLESELNTTKDPARSELLAKAAANLSQLLAHVVSSTEKQG